MKRHSKHVWRDPGRVSGELCFRDTRVPVAIMLDYLSRGQAIDEFLDDYPHVSRKQAAGYLAESVAATTAWIDPEPALRAQA